MKRSELPLEGLLTDVRVAFSAVSVAGPFFGSLCADYGADVIWIEQALMPSIERTSNNGFMDSDRKNMRNLALDIPSPEGRKVFLELMKETDIFLEASKGGQYERWGLSDEVLWEVNPKLIILHMSGFGLSGDPDYVNRASYDPIAQAFAGMMYANSQPGSNPKPAVPMIADYYTGLFAFGVGMASYIKMLKTGKGESADVNQFEALTRCMQYGFSDWNFPVGHPDADKWRFTPGILNSYTAGYNSYQCGDGNWVFTLIFGAPVMKRVFPILGIEYGSEEFPAKQIYRDFDPAGKRLNEAITAFCMKHTAAEVEKILSNAGCPAMCALTFDQMLTQDRKSVV